MRRVLPLCVVALLACGVCVSAAFAEPKHTIKDVMKAHKKGGLKDKVVDGSATAEEKKLLVEMYESMSEAKPPKGDAESWKAINAALVKAAKDVEAGKEGGVDELKKAVNCGACHSKHK